MEERKNMRTSIIVVSGLAVGINFVNVAVSMWEENYTKAIFFLLLLLCAASWLIDGIRDK